MVRCPSDNRLLLSTQFTDDQILDAMQFAVDDWNGTPPNAPSFTTTNFPWRYPWIVATAQPCGQPPCSSSAMMPPTMANTAIRGVPTSSAGMAFLDGGQEVRLTSTPAGAVQAYRLSRAYNHGNNAPFLYKRAALVTTDCRLRL